MSRRWRKQGEDGHQLHVASTPLVVAQNTSELGPLVAEVSSVALQVRSDHRMMWKLGEAIQNGTPVTPRDNWVTGTRVALLLNYNVDVVLHARLLPHLHLS